MMKKMRASLLLLTLLACLCGCAAALVGGGAAVGGGTGYFWLNGELKTDYPASFDKVWAAAEKTIASMNGMEVEPARSIGTGKIKAIINDEKVTVEVTFKDKNLTTVGVRVGYIGDETASKVIHAHIADNLKN